MKKKFLMLITIIIMLMGISTISQAATNDGFYDVEYYAEDYNSSTGTFSFGAKKDGSTYTVHIGSDGNIRGSGMGLNSAMNSDLNSKAYKAYVGVYCFAHGDDNDEELEEGRNKVYSRIKFRKNDIYIKQNVPDQFNTTLDYKDYPIAHYMLYALSKVNINLKKKGWAQAPQWIIWYNDNDINNFLKKVNKWLQVDINGHIPKSDYYDETWQSLNSYKKGAESYQTFMKEYKEPAVKTKEAGEYKDIGNKKLFGPFKITYNKCIFSEYTYNWNKKKNEKNTVKIGAIKGVQLFYSDDKTMKRGEGWDLCKANGTPIDPIDIESGKEFYIYLDKKDSNYDRLYNNMSKIRVIYKRVYLTGDMNVIGSGGGTQMWGVLGTVQTNPEEVTLDMTFKKESILTIEKKDAKTGNELTVPTRFALVKLDDNNKIQKFCIITTNKNSGTYTGESSTGVGFKFTGHIAIKNLQEGNYALYEECPSEGYDKNAWTAYMTANYQPPKKDDNGKKLANILPNPLTGHETFYYCTTFKMNRTRHHTVTIDNSGSSIFTIKKLDADTNEELEIDTRFALVRLNVNNNGKYELGKHCRIIVDKEEHLGKFKEEVSDAAITFSGHISITGLPKGKYALYEQCPDGYDKQIWTQYMQNTYGSENARNGLPETLTGHETYYFCQSFELTDKEDFTSTINNSGRDPNAIILKKVSTSNPDEPLSVPTTFAIVKVNDEDDSIESYYSIDSEGTPTPSTSPTTFTFTGQISIRNLPEGTYRLYETEPPEGCREKDWRNELEEEYGPGPGGVDESWAYCGEFTYPSEEKIITVENDRDDQEITLKKIDATTKDELSVPATFVIAKVKDNDGSIESYYDVEAEGMPTPSTSPVPFTFTGNTVIKNLAEGTYRLYETEPPEGYEEEFWRSSLEEKYGKGPGGVDKSWAYCGEFIFPSEEKEVVVENKKPDDGEDMSINGTVWRDNISELKNGTFSDALFLSDDTPLSGVTVELKDSKGTTIQTTTTSSNGSYTIELKDIDKKQKDNILNNYYIRFSGYDSSLSPVQLNLKKEITNGSRAIKESNAAATTKNIISFSEYYNKNTNTVENINLGLKGEYVPNSGAVDEQIEYVKIVRGDYKFTYRYGASAYTDGGSMQYQTSARRFTQKLYPSDIAYNNDSGASNNELEVYVVYRITITNPETTKTEDYKEVCLNIVELTDTFDGDKYELSTDTSVADNYVINDITNWSGSGSTATCTDLSKFQGITGGATSAPTYIQFKLTQHALNDIVSKSLTYEDIAGYSSVAHAKGYHKYERLEEMWIPYEDEESDGGSDDDTAGTISRNIRASNDDSSSDSGEDSGEGEEEPKGYTIEVWIEHETDIIDMSSGALYIKFELTDTRTVSGNIFEDLNTEASKQLNELVGNGQKDSGEKSVSGVVVSLIDATTSDGRVANLYNGEWHQNGSTWNLDKTVATVDVNEDGSYSLEGIVPGKYYLQFTYGNEKVVLTGLDGNSIEKSINTTVDGTEIDINNYKSTIVQGLVKNAFENSGNESTWFLDAINEGDLSIALDSTSNNKEGNLNSDTPISTRINAEYKIYNEVEENTEIRSINAKSPNIDVKFEYRADNEISHNQVGNLVTDCTGMNFGIIQRPYTDLQLTRQITNLKVTLNNGTTIINWTPYSTTEQEPYIAAMGNKNNIKGYKEEPENIKIEKDRTNSYLKAEMDELNIYGSTLEVKYEIVVTNLSQVDYATENYYKYGEQKEKMVKTKASKIVDYLPSGFNITFATEDSQTTSSELTSEQYEQEKNNKYITQESFDTWKEDAYKKYEITSEKQLNTQIGKTKEEIERNKKENCLVYEFLITKQLTSQEKDMEYNSATEITEVKNSSLTKRTAEMYQYNPGSYDGSIKSDENDTDSPDERDNDYARITIIPSTGANQSLIIYIVLGISMIIFATGIVLIKKFVLNKK